MEPTVHALLDNLESSIAAKQSLMADSTQLNKFAQAVEIVIDTYRRGGRIYIAGNGGSSSDAQHLAAELVCKLSTPRAPLAAEALSADAAILTAIGNDFSFDDIFARQIECKMTQHDAFLAMSTSGQSRNIVRALEQCREMGARSILLGGRGGGRAAELADLAIIVPGDNSCRVQEVHIVLYHTLVACVESALFADEPARGQADAPALSAIASS